MCEVPSWIVTPDGREHWLTDRDVMEHCQTQPSEICWADYTGHRGINRVLGVTGEHHEGFPCPPALQEDLRSLRMLHICRVADNIAAWPSEMAPVLSALAADQYADVRWLVAQSLRTPAKALAAIAVDHNAAVRLQVAQNPRTPAKALAALAGDDDVSVRRQVAQNTSTPATALSALACDTAEDVRWLVAQSPRTPAKVLAALAVDHNAAVRWQVAQNPRTPAKALAALACDTTADVRENAKRTIAQLKG